MNTSAERSAQAEQTPNVLTIAGQPYKRGQRKPPVDIERMGQQYIAGKLTTREIGKLHDRSAAFVVEQAKRRGWKRNVTAQARIAASALVNQPQGEEAASLNADPLVMSEVDAMARAMAGVRRSHRELIEAQRVQLSRLIDEMRTLAEDGETLLAIIARANAAVDEKDQLKIAAAGIRRILALPSRIYGIKKASDAAKNLIVLERQAFDLDVPDEGKAPPPRDANLSPADVFAWMSQLKPA